MEEQANPAAVEKPVVFDAMLTPHRSLGPRGFVVLMSAVVAVAFLTGLGFYLIGAWPVIGFMGCEVVLVYLAFRINFRRAEMYEQLALSRESLEVRRVNPWGEERRWRFQSYWLQVEFDETAGAEGELVLRSHGRSLVIGRFLTPGERLDLARTLQRELARLRCPPCRPAPV
jgi:uncharacterized membrane protein